MLNRKHIKVPRSFDPGPGHPREHLAYLNKREMEMLRVLTDGTVSRGPKGLPSFAEDRPAGPGGPNGPNSGGSTTTSGGGSKGPGGTGGGSKGPGGGSLSSPNRTEASAASSSQKAAGGVSAAKAPTSSATARSPSTASPSAPKAPSSPMSGQGPSFGSSAAAAAYNRSATARAAPTPSSPMGGQGASFASPEKAASSNRSTASAIKSGMNPSGSQNVASGVSQSQKDAYKTFGDRMAAAPRHPEVTRTPGDAEQLARMARAENNIIRDPVTGKMSQLAAQGTMNVIRNRMENQGLSVNGVISQKGQFSPWSDGNYASTPPSAAETAMAEQVLRGVTPDYTATPTYPQGADYYHNETTVRKNSGFQKSSAATQNRIKDRFEATLSVNDAVKPSVYGHTYGVDPSGRPANQTKSVPMAAPRNGGTNYGSGYTPTPENLPAGALSPDPNWGAGLGQINYSAPGPTVSSVPGRFGGLRPSNESMGQNISYGVDAPARTYGMMGRVSDYNNRFEDDGVSVDANTLAGRASSFTGALPNGGLSPSIGAPMYNENGVEMVDLERNSRGKVFDPADGTAAQLKMNQALMDTALRTGQPIGMFSGNDDRGMNHVGHASDINLRDPVTGGYLDGQKLATERTVSPAVAAEYDRYANDVFDSLYQNPDVYGGIGPRSRWGGEFTQGVPGDYMHFDTTPGGGWSAGQSALHREARARAGGADGFGSTMVASAAQPMPTSQGPGVPGLGSISGLLSGLNTKQVRDTFADPKIGTFLKNVNNPLTGGIAKAAFDAAVGPQVKAAAGRAIQSIKDTFDPSKAPARSSSPSSSGGRPSDSVSAPNRSEGSRGSKASGADNPDRGKGGDRENGRQKPKKPEAPKPIRRRRREQPEAPAPVDWSYYTTVKTREQALRDLLGKEWFE